MNRQSEVEFVILNYGDDEDLRYFIDLKASHDALMDELMDARRELNNLAEEGYNSLKMTAAIDNAKKLT